MKPTIIARLALGVLALSATLSGTAGAADQFTITIYPENLSSSAAVERTYARIERKVGLYCRTNGKRTLAEIRLERECVTATMNDVIAEIGDRRLSALHRSEEQSVYAAR